MRPIDIRVSSIKPTRIRSLCGFLGSFDPIHKGHEWIVEYLLTQFDAVLLLIPVFHFEKTVQFPRNATFAQRLTMLTSLAARYEHRIAVGFAHEVLFLRLADYLAERFPHSDIAFGMGNETFTRFLTSKTYYERLGLMWTEREQARLEELSKKIVVFGRSHDTKHYIKVPDSLRRISSTQVRKTVMELRKSEASDATWKNTLEQLISPEVLHCILKAGTYSAFI